MVWNSTQWIWRMQEKENEWPRSSTLIVLTCDRRTILLQGCFLSFFRAIFSCVVIRLIKWVGRWTSTLQLHYTIWCPSISEDIGGEAVDILILSFLHKPALKLSGKHINVKKSVNWAKCSNHVIDFLLQKTLIFSFQIRAESAVFGSSFVPFWLF